MKVNKSKAMGFSVHLVTLIFTGGPSLPINLNSMFILRFALRIKLEE